MLRVKLFGKGEASYNGQPLAGFPGKQCHRLLCYLMLNREHPHPRERLAAVFWAEYPTATSRTYLRTCLWRLRQSLTDAGASADGYLQCKDDSLSFATSGPGAGHYWLDVEAFQGALDPFKSLPGDWLNPDQARGLEEADHLYSADLLEATYDDWCLYDRERLRLMHMSLLCKLLAYHEAAGTYEQGLEYAHRILACDPLREKVHRQAMRLYWLLGNPQEALAQYSCCVQVLREELGVEPTSKTTALYDQMLHNRFDPSLWPVHLKNGLPKRLAREVPSEPAAEQLLDRLCYLEAVTESTGAELREVRRLVESVLAGAGRER